MKTRLTQTVVNSIKPNPDKPQWYTDSMTQNLRLYVGTSGKKVWYVRYLFNGKEKTHKLGVASEALPVAQARYLANIFIARLDSGEEPQKKSSNKIQLGEFLTNEYEPWVLKNHKSGKKTLDMMRSTFAFLLIRNIDEITQLEIERWRLERQSQVKSGTINRRLASLKSALRWGAECGIIETSPLEHMKRLKEHDSDLKVRYLSDNERVRLMEAIDSREKRIRDERNNHNEWLSEREYVLMPALNGEYADHLKPMILLSLHTGIRQGNVFSLLWGDVEFDSQTITLRAAVTKGGKTLRLPINSVAIFVLSAWRDQSINTSPEALVFPSPRSGKRFDNLHSAWERLLADAGIENFRWHDMRHDFASQLVMRGIDLNTVRELMGHSSMDMTLRYAHLAPKSKLRAAEVLAHM